jgi:hypothetical protein
MRLRVGAAAAVALAVTLAGAVPARATEGSVPLEVATFVGAPDGLIAELEDFLGPGVDGTGIDFDDSTEMGTVDRVFTFSPAWLAGQQTDAPVSLANEWTVPVTVGGDPVGVAVVWINPTSVRPQLADFVPDVGFATALTDVPEGAYLVHDADRAAWFQLEQPRLLAIVSGTSGVRSETSLTLYQASLRDATDAPSPGQTADLGSILSVATIAAVTIIVILALLIPAAWRRRRSRADED